MVGSPTCYHQASSVGPVCLTMRTKCCVSRCSRRPNTTFASDTHTHTHTLTHIHTHMHVHSTVPAHTRAHVRHLNLVLSTPYNVHDLKYSPYDAHVARKICLPPMTSMCHLIFSSYGVHVALILHPTMAICRLNFVYPLWRLCVTWFFFLWRPCGHNLAPYDGHMSPEFCLLPTKSMCHLIFSAYDVLMHYFPSYDARV